MSTDVIDEDEDGSFIRVDRDERGGFYVSIWDTVPARCHVEEYYPKPTMSF